MTRDDRKYVLNCRELYALTLDERHVQLAESTKETFFTNYSDVKHFAPSRNPRRLIFSRRTQRLIL